MRRSGSSKTKPTDTRINHRQMAETFFSRAARRNEEEAARGTDWERTLTAEGKRQWREKRALLAGTWSGKRPGSRLTPGLYSADRLGPRPPTPGAVRAQEQKMAGRGARSSEFQRRRSAIAAAYPTLATPLEPEMAAWGKRAPPPCHPPPDKPRMAGKLLKWRPTMREHPEAVGAWKTRWVEVRVEAEVRPAFETLAEEQQCLVTEVVEDLRSLGKSQIEIDDILKSVKHPLRERRAADKAVAELLFSAEAEDRRRRRRLRPVLRYCHSRGGRELGRVDLRGATLTRSYRPQQAQQAPTQRPLVPSDVRPYLTVAVKDPHGGHTTAATFSCDKAAAAAEEYLQSWYEQLAFAIWETDLTTNRSPWEADTPVEKKPPPQAGPRSFDPPGGPRDGPVHKAPGHPAYYLPPPASLYAVRGKLRHELEETAVRYVPFQGGLYRNVTDEMEVAAATRAAMQWRSGGKASNGDVRWKPLLDDRKTAVLKAFAVISDGTATGKSVGEVAAEAA